MRSSGFFDSGQLVERSTPVRTIEVVGRPSAPDGFSGAVGDLRYSASLEPAEIEYGQSAVMTVKLEGRGNLPLVETPVRFPDNIECEIYPPEEDSRVKVDGSGIHGSRTWQMTVVPRGSGPIELGGVDLSVFDPSTGAVSPWGYVKSASQRPRVSQAISANWKKSDLLRMKSFRALPTLVRL